MAVLINPFGFVPQPTWNASDKDGDITLSNGDLTATLVPVVNEKGSVRALVAISAGKVYIEATSGAAGSNSSDWRFGIGKSTMSLAAGVGQDANGWALQGNGQKITNGSASAYGTANSNSDNLMLALDATAGSLWFGRAGTWLNSGDPAAGTGAAFTGLSGPFYLAFGAEAEGIGRAITLKGVGAYLYSPPSGFSRGG